MIHAPYADLFSLADHDRPELAIENYIEAVIFRRIVEPEGVAAIIVEPVLGEGGYFAPPAEWLQRLREICDTHGILLIADEVQCGVGRTGRMWAIEHAGVEPDIVISAKGLASGMPLGAMIARESVTAWTSGTHGSTFGGNPVSCAAALTTLDLVQGGLMDNARRIGERMLHALDPLRALPGVRDVRGIGLMLGVEFETARVADSVQQGCFERGLLVLRAGEATVRISPPLVLTETEARIGTRLFGEVCAAALEAPLSVS